MTTTGIIIAIVIFVELLLDSYIFLSIDGRNDQFPCMTKFWWGYNAFVLIQCLAVIHHYNLWC